MIVGVDIARATRSTDQVHLKHKDLWDRFSVRGVGRHLNDKARVDPSPLEAMLEVGARKPVAVPAHAHEP